MSTVVELPELGFEHYLIDGDHVTLCQECAVATAKERGEKLVFLGWSAEGVLCSRCEAKYDPDAEPSFLKRALVEQFLLLDQHGEAAGLGPGECAIAQMAPVYIAMMSEGLVDIYTLLHRALHLAIRYGYQKGIEVGQSMVMEASALEEEIERIVAELEQDEGNSLSFPFSFIPDEELGD